MILLHGLINCQTSGICEDIHVLSKRMRWNSFWKLSLLETKEVSNKPILHKYANCHQNVENCCKLEKHC